MLWNADFQPDVLTCSLEINRVAFVRAHKEQLRLVILLLKLSGFLLAFFFIIRHIATTCIYIPTLRVAMLLTTSWERQLDLSKSR